jgi:hypothetical protein
MTMPDNTPKFIWYELMTNDQDAAEAFYRAVIGWNMADFGQTGTGMRYTIASAGEYGVGGMMALTAEAIAGGARTGWYGYVGVPDTDAASKRIVAAGGTVQYGPDDIPEVGRFAMVADPGGAVFNLLTPLPRDDEPTAPDPKTPGIVSWRELYSSQGDEAAFDFYAGQFGWELMESMDMGEMGQYRIFGNNGVQMGGIMSKPENIPASTWGYYVNVDGIDAAIERVKANGGQVLMGPEQVPGGGWIIQCMDPQGAAFALISYSR